MLADATGLTGAYSVALHLLRPRGTGHDPGRIMTDLVVMLADGGEAITDLAVLRDQAEVFDPVASTSTAWRLLADTDSAALASLRAARASAREVAWMQAAETGEGISAVRAAGRELPGLVLDLDATLITCHSEKEQAAPTYKCQRSLRCSGGRSLVVQAGGHQKSMPAASGVPERWGWSVQGDHPLAGEGLGEAVGVAGGGHEVGVMHEAIGAGSGEGLGHDRVEA